ncbi:MAG: histidine kinase [Xanthomonadales bacterium]|nr:histidine kinase [Xanthomonadales bacterium]
MAITLAPDAILSRTEARPGWLRVGLLAAAMLLVLALLQTLTLGDPAAPFLPKLLNNLRYYPPWLLYSVCCYVLLDRRREQLARPGTVAGAYAASILGFFLPYSFYSMLLMAGGQLAPLAALRHAWPDWLTNALFTDFVMFSGCFGSIYGLVLLRGQLARDRRNAQLQARMLTMQLQLQQHKLSAIQAQLEPHFLFNALTAISALVRADDQAGALSGIARLSDLLRYTLEASRREWVSLAEELEFLRGYLQLQRLRHGDRLQVHIEANEHELRDASCPPLLLQPLVENALRHDLDTHNSHSDIRLRISATDQGVDIELSNSVATQAVSNPGLGLGLRNTRELLQLRYGDQARLRTEQTDGRFQVALHLPEAPQR